MGTFGVSDGYITLSNIKKSLVLLFAIALITVTLSLVVGGFVMVLGSDGRFRFPWVFSVVTLLTMTMGGVINFIYGIKWLKSFTFTIGDDTVNTKGGILRKMDRTTNFQKITDVTIYQDIVAKWFGFATVGFQTAGSYITEIVFFGVSYGDAVKIRDLVYSKIGKK